MIYKAARLLQRIGTLLGVVQLVIACAAPTPRLVYQETPGFIPHDELIRFANWSVHIVAEGSGLTLENEPFYYVAYITKEPVVFPQPGTRPPGLGDRLWAEMQSLGKQRRATLDASTFTYLIVEARESPGSPESRARRSVFLARDGSWISDYSIHTPVNQ